jgi:hypothetical protein
LADAGRGGSQGSHGVGEVTSLVDGPWRKRKPWAEWGINLGQEKVNVARTQDAPYYSVS